MWCIDHFADLQSCSIFFLLGLCWGLESLIKSEICNINRQHSKTIAYLLVLHNKAVITAHLWNYQYGPSDSHLTATQSTAYITAWSPNTESAQRLIIMPAMKATIQMMTAIYKHSNIFSNYLYESLSNASSRKSWISNFGLYLIKRGMES